MYKGDLLPSTQMTALNICTLDKKTRSVEHNVTNDVS